MRTLVTDLAEIAERVQTQRDEFDVMRYRLQLDDGLDDAALDTFVEALVAPIVAAIDCTRCGNCCRALVVYLEERDVARLAEGLQTSFERVLEDYVDVEAAHTVGEWGAFKHKPCAFLRGTRCGVYAHRPQTCRDYPAFTPEFRWMLDDLLDGAPICPIIYNVLNALLDHVDKLTASS